MERSEGVRGKRPSASLPRNTSTFFFFFKQHFHVKLSHEIETWNRRNKAEAARRPSMEDTSRDSLGRTCKPNVDWATATCHRGTADGTQPTATGLPSVSSTSIVRTPSSPSRAALLPAVPSPDHRPPLPAANPSSSRCDGRWSRLPPSSSPVPSRSTARAALLPVS